MKRSIAALCLLAAILCCTGCVAVPFAGDRITVKTDDATMLVIVDLDLLTSPEIAPLLAAALKAPYLPSERVTPEDAQPRADTPTEQNATAFRRFATGSIGTGSRLKEVRCRKRESGAAIEGATPKYQSLVDEADRAMLESVEAIIKELDL